MDDLISRQDAIDAVRTFYADNYALEDSIEELLEKLPSAQQPLVEQLRWERDVAVKQLEDLGYAFGEKPLPSAPRWIPCSERLPDEDGTYIVTGKKGAVYSISYRDDGHWWYGGNKPLAWMPMPAAWEGWDK